MYSILPEQAEVWHIIRSDSMIGAPARWVDLSPPSARVEYPRSEWFVLHSPDPCPPASTPPPVTHQPNHPSQSSPTAVQPLQRHCSVNYPCSLLAPLAGLPLFNVHKTIELFLFIGVEILTRIYLYNNTKSTRQKQKLCLFSNAF